MLRSGVKSGEIRFKPCAPSSLRGRRRAGVCCLTCSSERKTGRSLREYDAVSIVVVRAYRIASRGGHLTTTVLPVDHPDDRAGHAEARLLALTLSRSTWLA